jgi:hypothetical protein
MRLFTRFLALWFLLFTLMSSTAWACAECPELVASTAGFAQENLMLAKAALEEGNSHQARVLLAES